MPRKTAHQRLEQLHQSAAGQQVKVRETDHALVLARREVEDIAARIEAAYIAEDDGQAAEHRSDIVKAEAEVVDRQHRLNAATKRAADAVAAVSAFRIENAKALIAERDDEAKQIADALREALDRVVSLDARWSAHVQATNQLVAITPGAQPLNDGAVAEHGFTSTLRTLRSLLSQGHEIPVPVPQWQGQAVQHEQDNVHRLLKLRRAGGQVAVDEYYHGAA